MNKESKIRNEEDFSDEIKVLAKIYEYNKVKKKPIWFKRLTHCFRGKISRGAISKSLDKLYFSGMTDEEQQKIDDERWAQCFFVDSLAMSFAKEVYDNIRIRKA